MTALAGANIIYGLGMMEMGMTFDFGQLVMDNEFARMIKYNVLGIPVNDETLSVEAIHEVGPFNDFVSREETFTYMKSISHPKLIDRRNRDKWVKKGGRDIYLTATEEARALLEQHKPEPLSEEKRKALRAIVEETEDALGIGRHDPDF